jgi:hypothetical protein
MPSSESHTLPKKIFLETLQFASLNILADENGYSICSEPFSTLSGSAAIDHLLWKVSVP